MRVNLHTEHHLEFLSLTDAAQARLSLHLSNCHIVENHMSRLSYHSFIFPAFNLSYQAHAILLLSCHPRVTVMSYFVYKVIMDLSSIDHLCINPIRRIGLVHK